MGFAKPFRHIKDHPERSAQKVSGDRLKESLKRQFEGFKNAVSNVIHKYPISPRRSPSPQLFGIATASDPSVVLSNPRRWPVSNPDPPNSDASESDTPDPEQEPEPEQEPVSEHSPEFEQESVPKKEHGPEPRPEHELGTELYLDPGLSCSSMEELVRNRESRPLSDSSLDAFERSIETGYVAQARRLYSKAQWDEYMDMGHKII